MQLWPAVTSRQPFDYRQEITSRVAGAILRHDGAAGRFQCSFEAGEPIVPLVLCLAVLQVGPEGNQLRRAAGGLNLSFLVYAQDGRAVGWIQIQYGHAMDLVFCLWEAGLVRLRGGGD